MLQMIQQLVDVTFKEPVLNKAVLFDFTCCMGPGKSPDTLQVLFKVLPG